MYFLGALREENKPEVICIRPDKDVVDRFVVAVSFPRDVPKQELFGARFDDVV